MKFYLIILLFILFFSCKSKTFKGGKLIVIDTTPRILTSGLRDMMEEIPMNVVAKAYGFHFYHVGGCVNSKKLSDSIRFQNAMICSTLEKKYGHKMWGNFYKKVEIIRDLQTLTEAILRKDSAIIKLNYDLQKELYYEIEPISEKQIILVHAFQYEKIHDQYEKVIYYSVAVNSLKEIIISFPATSLNQP